MTEGSTLCSRGSVCVTLVDQPSGSSHSVERIKSTQPERRPRKRAAHACTHPRAVFVISVAPLYLMVDGYHPKCPTPRSFIAALRQVRISFFISFSTIYSSSHYVPFWKNGLFVCFRVGSMLCEKGGVLPVERAAAGGQRAMMIKKYRTQYLPACRSFGFLEVGCLGG